MFLSLRYSPKFSANEYAALLPLGSINPYNKSETEIISLFRSFADVPFMPAALEFTCIYVSLGSHSISSIRSMHIIQVIILDILAIILFLLALHPQSILFGRFVKNTPQDVEDIKGRFNIFYTLLYPSLEKY